MINFIKNIFACSHKNALLNSNEGYCPDCGKYLKKAYLIIRCSCCDIKRHSHKHLGEIKPLEKFCTNCGSKGYIIEKYDKLNLVDIDYALEIKEVHQRDINDSLEIWIEKDEAPDFTPLIPMKKCIEG